MSIALRQLFKSFEGHPVVHDVTLDVGDGEFFVLLGPSGSGKSTVLRMIAGLLEEDAGRVLLRGVDVTGVPPQKRGVGFVFQSYALFRHMTVADNVEFALRIRRANREERRRRRAELLDLVGLSGLEARYPHQLSGGQQQRVALARALAHRPEVLLLDEPFGALDAKIRVELRRSLKAIQRELGVTTVFVTHDQEEAFELADRIGVMNEGRLLEVGPPTELYLRPRTEFVATFLGRANLMVGECRERGVRVGPIEIPFDAGVRAHDEVHRVQILFRPEDVAVKQTREALRWPSLGEGTVLDAEFSGSIERLRLRLPHLAGVRMIAPQAPYGADYAIVDAIRSQHQARMYPLAPGDRAHVGLRRAHVLLHPGLRFVALARDAEGAAALASLGHIARLAHARVTAIVDGKRASAEGARASLQGAPSVDVVSTQDAEAADAALRSGGPCDLIARAKPSRDAAAAVEELVAMGTHHVLLLGPQAPLPRHAVIAIALGEPGKDDVLFAGRLLRHLGTEATLLTVLDGVTGAEERQRAARFLEAGVRTLAGVGVRARALVRVGIVGATVRALLAELSAEMLVMGVPLAKQGERPRLAGVARELIEKSNVQAILCVRSTVRAAEGERP